MQTLRIMATSCLHQIAGLSVSSKNLAAPSKLGSLRCLSVSCSSLQRSWWRQTYSALTSISDKKLSITGRGNMNVFAQAISTTPETDAEAGSESSGLVLAKEEVPARLKTKKLTKQVKHIMDILNAEAVEAASKDKVLPILRPGDVVQLRLEVPENKRRVSLLRGIVIAIHNGGINSTFRIRRVLAGVGVEMVFPLYSPNIKELKVVDHRKARRAKLFYLRDKIARMSTC